MEALFAGVVMLAVLAVAFSILRSELPFFFSGTLRPWPLLRLLIVAPLRLVAHLAQATAVARGDRADKVVCADGCGREISTWAVVTCSSCGHRSQRRVFAPCPACGASLRHMRCPYCTASIPRPGLWALPSQPRQYR